LLLGGLVTTAYIKVNYFDLEVRQGFPNTLDCIMGIILVIVVIEATREAWGWALPIIVGFGIIYAFVGHLIPGPLRSISVPITFTISYLCIGLAGVFGILLAASANMIFLFLVFGALLITVGAPAFFVEVGKVASRYLAGGPAQAAVVGSTLVGMCTGAAVANVAITGSMTIPMMKSMGYTPEQAAAIEANASTGSQYMAPVMGASPFVMAAILAIAYADIMIAAFFPAVLFFLSAGLGVQFMALKNRIPRIKEKISTRIILLRAPLFFVPLAVLMTLLLRRFSPMYAAFYAILAIIGVSLFQKETRPSLAKLAEGLKNGAIMGARIGIALACVGILAQVLETTGLGIKLAGLIGTLCGGHLIIALILCMVVCIILGMGVPTVAAYVMVAVIGAPVLLQLGLGTLPAHFFVFYFAVVSAITPPVALAAMTGATIAGANYWKAGFQAFRLGVAGYILPFFFVYNPIFLLRPTDPVWGGISIVGFLLTLVAVHVANFGYMLTDLSPTERVLFFLAGVILTGACLIHNYILIGAGFLLFTGLFLWQRSKSKTQKVENSTVEQEVKNGRPVA